MIDYNRIFSDTSIGPLSECLQQYFDTLVLNKNEVQDRIKSREIQYKGAITLKEKVEQDPSQIVIRFRDDLGNGKITPDMDSLLSKAEQLIQQYQQDEELLKDLDYKLNLFSNSLQSPLNMLLAIKESTNA